jgi:L-threonylcarbamoyladenylate synthase
MIRTERIDCAGLLAGPERLASVARRIRDGAVFVYPTETIYGIGGRADREDVRERILVAKGRAADNPMILLAADPRVFERHGARFSAEARRLADAFWPGRVTLVVSDAAGGTVAVRQSDHPFVTAIGPLVDAPLFSTSANLSGESYDSDPTRIWRTFDGRVDFMIDCGALPPSAPSTVVRALDGEPPAVLREGAVSAEAIRGVLRG